MHGPLQYQLDPKRITTFLAVLAGILLTVHLFAAYAWAEGDWFIFTERDWVSYKYVKMFDLDEEESFGTWFAAIILLFSGRLLLMITHDSRRAGDGFWGWWLILAIGFHYLSIDEVAGMHEYVNTYRDDFGWVDVNWTHYAAVVVLMIFAFYIPFLVLLTKAGHKKTMILMMISGAIYIGGAVVVEKFGPHDDFDAMAYNMGWVTWEEGFEMAGIILFIYTLLDYLRGTRDTRIVVDVTPLPKDGKAAA